MNWTSILISVVSLVLTTLAGWGVAKLTALIDNKIEEGKLKSMLTDAINVVTNVVKEVFQTFVETLKEKGEFDEDFQKEALSKAIEKAKTLIPEATKSYIETHFGSFDKWLTTQIESTIYSLKNSISEGNK